MADIKLTEQLEHLLSICNDGVEGYTKAAQNAKSAEYRNLFTDYVIQRTEYANDLKDWLRRMDGDAHNNSGGPIGALHRLWIDIKTKLSSDEEHAALAASISGEKAAVKAYDDVLVVTNLSAELRELLQHQRDGIERALINAEQLVKVLS